MLIIFASSSKEIKSGREFWFIFGLGCGRLSRNFSWCSSLDWIKIRNDSKIMDSAVHGHGNQAPADAQKAYGKGNCG